MYEASKATITNNAATPAKVSGSVALMPNNRFDINLVNANAPATPSVIPIRVSFSPS